MSEPSVKVSKPVDLSHLHLKYVRQRFHAPAMHFVCKSGETERDINLHIVRSPPLILWAIGLYFIHPEDGNWSVFRTTEQLNKWYSRTMKSAVGCQWDRGNRNITMKLFMLFFRVSEHSIAQLGSQLLAKND